MSSKESSSKELWYSDCIKCEPDGMLVVGIEDDDMEDEHILMRMSGFFLKSSLF